MMAGWAYVSTPLKEYGSRPSRGQTTMQVVVGILQRCEARLLEMTDMEKMVAFLKVEVPQWRHDTLQVCTSTFCCLT